MSDVLAERLAALEASVAYLTEREQRREAAENELAARFRARRDLIRAVLEKQDREGASPRFEDDLASVVSAFSDLRGAKLPSDD